MAAGRPKDFNNEYVLDRAIEVFCTLGYEAASTEDLLKAMKLGKGSMYHAFGSKRELFDLALNRYLDKFIVNFERELNESSTPIELIKNFFLVIADEEPKDHRNGCFLGNSVVGLAGVDPNMSKHAANKLKAIEEVFFIHIRRAQMQQQLKTTEDPKILARLLITFWNGLNITRRMYPDNKVLLPLIKSQLKILH
jgi:TetR/AcrR family transcriptional regulator, transcriptional repressor for nem operon